MDVERTTHICVQPQPRRHAHRQVSEQAHEEGRERRDGGGRGDEVAVDLLNARRVVGVRRAHRVGGGRADARPAGVRQDGGVDRDLDKNQATSMMQKG